MPLECSGVLFLLHAVVASARDVAIYFNIVQTRARFDRSLCDYPQPSNTTTRRESIKVQGYFDLLIKEA